ncbi:MAG TPA: glycosyltransferase [Opitutaceae bacterium]|jgi:glycosyltransferase involved in cell wall biosynthesis|nr:glycosyltransferase [Opitutaceae bacterium]
MPPLLFVGISSMRDDASQHKLYFLADILGRRGTPVTVLVPDLAENRAYFADKPHVATHYYPPGSALADAWRKSQFVHTRPWSAIWVVGVGVRSYLRRSRDVPMIQDLDEFPSMIASFGRLRRIYLQWIERRMVARAQGFTCASALLENAVRRQRPDLGPRLLRMPVAISASEQQVDPALVSQLEKAAAGHPVLVYVGSMNRFYEDQLDEIIALAGVLRRRGSPARLRILGGGPDLEYFKAKASAAQTGENLEFAGHVRRPELASHLEAAQVLVFPFAANAFNLSRCPTKAFHYAAANRPVVTNRVGEVASLFGDAASYYPERDVEALADRCQEALARTEPYENGIPPATLTWEARAQTFSEWLSAQGWMPAGPRGAGPS